MDAQPARITVTRTSSTDIQQRQVIVSIGDTLKATLAFGDSVTWDIPAGSHVLKSNNTLVWKKNAFDAAPGEHVHFTVANRASRFTLGFLALLGVAPLGLVVERNAPAAAHP